MTAIASNCSVFCLVLSSMCWLVSLISNTPKSFYCSAKRKMETFPIVRRKIIMLEMLLDSVNMYVCVHFIYTLTTRTTHISIEKWNKRNHSEHVNSLDTKNMGIGLVTLLVKLTATAVENCTAEQFDLFVYFILSFVCIRSVKSKKWCSFLWADCEVFCWGRSKNENQ